MVAAVQPEPFQSTLPVGGATLRCPAASREETISIHAPRGGSDQQADGYPDLPADFNPRSPWGERQTVKGSTPRNRRFQSTLPVGGATQHMRLEGGPGIISIHAPRGGSDPQNGRRRTEQNDFNPRSPWGERPFSPTAQRLAGKISIHAPRGGSDVCYFDIIHAKDRFQSTLPVGGATYKSSKTHQTSKYFNPRSPWGERPSSSTGGGARNNNFNPRSPWGERRGST